jgi:cell division protein FtsB
MKLRKTLVWLLLAALAVFAITFFFGSQGVYYQFRQVKLKEQEVVRGRHTIDSLQTEIRNLTYDTGAIERIARERLGMVRKNETVYKFLYKKE